MRSAGTFQCDVVEGLLYQSTISFFALLEPSLNLRLFSNLSILNSSEQSVVEVGYSYHAS
jgi:hypothetical protein